VKTAWPLKEGFVGLTLQNLNEFINSFWGCLIHVHNYQGIDLIPLDEPIVLSRFDVFGYWHEKAIDRELCRAPIEKTPSLDKMFDNFTTDRSCYAYVIDRSTSARWYCEAKFDLFFPERQDAKHYHYAYFNNHPYFGYYMNQESLNFGVDGFKTLKKSSK